MGVYGPSESEDKRSASFMKEIKEIIRELQHVYNTQHIIILGDFNAVFSYASHREYRNIRN
jgi:metallophosphoesterase superfamily enzyme